jgi:hypothetical protein
LRWRVRETRPGTQNPATGDHETQRRGTGTQPADAPRPADASMRRRGWIHVVHAVDYHSRGTGPTVRNHNFDQLGASLRRTTSAPGKRMA